MTVTRLVQLWRRARQADGPGAVIVGTANLLLLCVLLLLMIGATPFPEPTTLAEEDAAERLGAQLFGCWLAGGLVLFLVLGMVRTLFSHLATMLLPPVALMVAFATAV